MIKEEKFIRRTAGDMAFNLKKLHRENGKKRIIMPFSTKQYERIVALLPQINERLEYAKMEATIDNDLRKNEVRISYKNS